MKKDNVPVIPDSAKVNKLLESKLIEHSFDSMPFKYRKSYYELLKLAYSNHDELFRYDNKKKCFICKINLRKFAVLLRLSNGTVANNFLKYLESLGLISRKVESINKPFITCIYDFFYDLESEE